MIFSKDSADTMQNFVEVINNTNTHIYLSYAFDQDYKDIAIDNNAGGFLHFGRATEGGKSHVLPTYTISQTGGGVGSGTLDMDHVTVEENTDLEGTNVIQIDSSTFMKEVKTKGRLVSLYDNNFHGKAIFTGTSVNGNLYSGGNIYYDTLISNSVGSNFRCYYSSTKSDSMIGAIYLNNQPTGLGHYMSDDASTYFLSKVYLDNKAGQPYYFGRNGHASYFPDTALLLVGDSGFIANTVYLHNSQFTNNQELALTGAATLNINTYSRFQNELATSAPTIIMQDSSVTGALRFNGNLNQSISSHDNTLQVQQVILDKTNANTVTLSTDIDVADTVSMLGGLLQSSSSNMLRMLNDSEGKGGNDTSYIQGPIQKIGSNGSMLPIGGNGKLKSLTMTSAVAATDTFQAEFFRIDPQSSGYTRSSTSGMKDIASCEYWQFDRINGSNYPDVTLFANDDHCHTGNDVAAAIWDGSKWEKSGTGYISGGNLSIIFTGLTHLSPLTYAAPITTYQDFFIMFEN